MAYGIRGFGTFDVFDCSTCGGTGKITTPLLDKNGELVNELGGEGMVQYCPWCLATTWGGVHEDNGIYEYEDMLIAAGWIAPATRAGRG